MKRRSTPFFLWLTTLSVVAFVVTLMYAALTYDQTWLYIMTLSIVGMIYVAVRRLI